MKPLLVDTDVFSFVFKRDSRAAGYEPLLRGRTLCLSFMSVAELHAWAIAKRWGGKRRLQPRESVDRHIVVPFDMEMAECWARISESRKKGGRPIATSDCWIAATAARHELELVTHNGRDFVGIEGLVVHSR